MKRFVGGTDGAVAMLDEHGVVWLGHYEWGDQSPSCAALAKAVLTRVLGDEQEAVRLHRRFMAPYRQKWRKGEQWSMTDQQVLAVIDDIEQKWREAAPDVYRMQREPPRGATVMGIPDTSQWGGTHNQSNQPPEIQRNDPRKAK